MRFSRVGVGQCYPAAIRERDDRRAGAAVHQRRLRPARLRAAALERGRRDYHGAKDATISTGAQDGSEMGAFARDKNPIKERSILIKYQEYMPLGLVPVIIDVT